MALNLALGLKPMLGTGPGASAASSLLMQSSSSRPLEAQSRYVTVFTGSTSVS